MPFPWLWHVHKWVFALENGLNNIFTNRKEAEKIEFLRSFIRPLLLFFKKYYSIVDIVDSVRDI